MWILNVLFQIQIQLRIFRVPPIQIQIRTQPTLFKRSVSPDFYPSFIHDLNLSRPLINRLKYFEFDLAEIFKFFKSSAVCIILRSQT